MATGSPGLPTEFAWKGGRLRIAQVEHSWRETGPCSHGSGERYAKRHWFDVRTSEGRRAKIYFERSVRSRRPVTRWWLYSINA